MQELEYHHQISCNEFISPGIRADNAKCVLFTGCHRGVAGKSDASVEVEVRMRRRKRILGGVGRDLDEEENIFMRRWESGKFIRGGE